jgi:D-xylulose kinase
MDQYIAAIDVGTTGCRTLIFDLQGNPVGEAYREYTSAHPYPNWVEQNADLWWTAVCETIRASMRNANLEASAISAVAVTNQRETVVAVDENGIPLRPAIVWQDRRTVRECDNIATLIGRGKLYRITGLTIDPYFSASKILWIRAHQYDIFRKTHKFLLVHDYIVHKLTDRFVTDWSNASRTMLFDINRFCWSKLITDKLGIELEKLPTVYPSGTELGYVTRSASKSTGLSPDTRVFAGGGDQQCAAIGLGVITEGLIKATTGTGSFILAHLDTPQFEPKRRLLCSVHALPIKRWVLEASIFTTGAIYRWFRDNFSQYQVNLAKSRNIDVYELLNREVGGSPVGAKGIFVIPHFAGAGAPYWDADAKGAILGLALGHNRGDVLRAIIESICFEIRTNLELIQKLGINIIELRITGGAARSQLWNKIQADVYGKPVTKGKFEDATALGVAILASVGAGYHKTIGEAVHRMIKLERKLMPDQRNHESYTKAYRTYLKLVRLMLKHKISVHAHEVKRVVNPGFFNQ